MVPSGKQQLVWDLVGGARAPELALELELAAVLDWREDDPRDVLALGIMGMVSIKRFPPGARLCWGSCLGRGTLPGVLMDPAASLGPPPQAAGDLEKCL